MVEMDEEQPARHECYVFNSKLFKRLDSGACEHCKKYLTTECDKIDEFIDDIEALEDVD